MRKFLLSFLFLLFVTLSFSQTVTTTFTGTSANAIYGQSNYHVTEAIYLESEVGASNFTTAGTAINRVGFSINQAASTTTPLTGVNFPLAATYAIYMKNVTAATTLFTTGTYSLTGYTEVFNGPVTFAGYGWTSIALTTTFTRTAGSNLQVLIIRTNGVAPATNTAPSFDCSLGNSAAGTSALTTRRYNGTSVPAENSTSLGTSNFRPAIRLARTYANDAALSFTSVGKLPVGYASTEPVVAWVSNQGTNTLTNLTVTLNVTGANTYTANKNIASLAPGASTTVAFDGYVPSAVGSNNIAVSIPADDYIGNNSAPSQVQLTTSSTYALSNDDAFTPGGSIGFNTGSGNLLVKMPVYKNNNLVSVRASITTEASAATKTVRGVILSSAGAILAQSPDYVIQNADLGNYVTFTFPAPVAVAAGSTYYIGLGQVANAAGYYPVNTQGSKTNLAHSTILAGGAITDYNTFGSLMIEGLFANTFPVTLTSFNGIKESNVNRLFWTTSTEINNKGFELERSADGRTFSAIGFINSKAERGNSASTLSYSFTDEKPLAGTNYYRLKQVDNDGKFSYSSVVVLKGEKAFNISAVYPNPAKENIYVAINSTKAGKANIAITDLSGKTVKQIPVNLVDGDNNIQVNLNGLASGSYSIRLIMNDEVRTTQFVKQ